MDFLLFRRSSNTAHGLIHRQLPKNIGQNESLSSSPESDSDGMDLDDGWSGGFDGGFQVSDGFEHDLDDGYLRELGDEVEDELAQESEGLPDDHFDTDLESDDEDDASLDSVSVASNNDVEFDYQGCAGIFSCRKG